MTTSRSRRADGPTGRSDGNQRRGFALLTTLWLMVALAALSATALATAKRRTWTGRNRIMLRRTEWAREACLSVLRARYRIAARDAGEDAERLAALVPAELPRIDLGRGTWCSTHLEHPERRLNLNLADAAMLTGLLGRADQVDALLDWRDPDDLPRSDGVERDWYQAQGLPVPRNGPLTSLDELRLVRGFDSQAVARLAPLVTMNSDGRLDLNAAPVELVALLPGVTPELLAWIARRREGGERISSFDELAQELSPPSATILSEHSAELRSWLQIGPAQFRVVIEGHLDGRAIASTMRLLLAPAGHRLAVLRVEAS